MEKFSVLIPEIVKDHPAWNRLESQLEWYDSKSVRCHSSYKILKIFQITLAILIPSMSLYPLESRSWITGIAGSLIALIEAIQHLNQYSTLWITYRSTAERLKHEKFLFLSKAGHYINLNDIEAFRALSENVEELVSTEHANWINERKRVEGNT